MYAYGVLGRAAVIGAFEDGARALTGRLQTEPRLIEVYRERYK